MVEVVAAAYLQPRGFLQKLRMIDDEKKRFDSQRRYITGSMWQPPPRSAPSNLQICFFGGWWWGSGGQRGPGGVPHSPSAPLQL